MTVLAGIRPDEVTDAKPAQGLFHSPIGLFPFQADHMARAYWQVNHTPTEPVVLALWDTGLGKTVLALATAALSFEDGMIDQIIVVAERGKVLDWAEDDVPGFTDFTVKKYSGKSPEDRKKMLADPPDVLVMTWETGRNDICEFKPKSKAVTKKGMLAEFCEGKRVLFVLDEHVKMRSRSTHLYTAWDYLFNRVLRRQKDQGLHPRILALSGGLIERDPIDHWNACRVIAPWRAGTVAWMERTYVATWDIHEQPATFKNLTRDSCEVGVTPLNELFSPITLRKSKFDTDVIEYFPKQVENAPTVVRLTAQQKGLYDRIEEILLSSPSEDSMVKGFTLLRQVAAYPEALLASGGEYARQVVEAIGADVLREMKSAKMDRLLEWQRRMGSQQTVIFTFFGQSVLPLVARDLREAGYEVSVNHGQMSERERKDSQDAFKSGHTQVFLSSDAGARGLNLGAGSALLHFDIPSLYSIYVQRSNRIHRIDSAHPSVTIDALMAHETVERGLVDAMVKRHDWDEKIKDDQYLDEADPGEGYLSAAVRRELMMRAERMAA